VEQASRYEHLRKDPDALFSIISKLESDLERLQVYLLNSNRKTFVAKSERQISSQELLIGFGEKPVTTKEEEEEEEVETLTVPEHKRILKRGRKPLPSNLPDLNLKSFSLSLLKRVTASCLDIICRSICPTP